MHYSQRSFHACCRYASEGIKAACDWAYKGAPEGSVLEGSHKILCDWQLRHFHFFIR